MFAHLSVFNQDTVPLNIISLDFNCQKDVCGFGIDIVNTPCHMVIVVIYSIVVSCCVSSSCIGDAQAVCTLDTYETKKLEIHT